MGPLRKRVCPPSQRFAQSGAGLARTAVQLAHSQVQGASAGGAGAPRAAAGLHGDPAPRCCRGSERRIRLRPGGQACVFIHMMYALHTYVTHDVHCTNKLYLTCIQVMHTSYVLYTIRMVNTHCIHAPRPPAHLHVLGLHVLHDGDERVQRRAAAPPRAADAPNPPSAPKPRPAAPSAVARAYIHTHQHRERRGEGSCLSAVY